MLKDLSAKWQPKRSGTETLGDAQKQLAIFRYGKLKPESPRLLFLNRDLSNKSELGATPKCMIPAIKLKPDEESWLAA